MAAPINLARDSKLESQPIVQLVDIKDHLPDGVRRDESGRYVLNDKQGIKKSNVDNCLKENELMEAVDSVLNHCHPVDKKTFQCNYCQKKMNKTRMELHLNEHVDYWPWRCKECDYRSKKLKYLKAHVKHHCSRLYECQYCKKAFASRDKLVVHERYHTNERPFECSLCGAAFHEKTALMRHSESVHHAKYQDVEEEVQKSGIEGARGKFNVTQKDQEVKLENFVSKKRPKYALERMTEGIGEYCEIQDDLVKGGTAHIFRCKLCSREFRTQRSQFEKHLVSDHQILPYKCPQCDFKGKTRVALWHHSFLHESAENRSCPICQKEFRFRNKLELHIRRHKDSANFCCEMCGKAFFEQYDLNNHIKRMHSQGTSGEYACEFCGKLYKVDADLKNHIRIKHSDNPRNHVCQVCGAIYLYRSSLTYHLKTHQNIQYYCEICNLHFNSEVVLRKHAKAHDPHSATLVCSVCERRFFTPSELRRHAVSHSQDRPFACTSCPKRFKTANALRAHNEIHNIREIWVCPQCSRSFRRRDALIQHMAQHDNQVQVEPDLVAVTSLEGVLADAGPNEVYAEKEVMNIADDAWLYEGKRFESVDSVAIHLMASPMSDEMGELSPLKLVKLNVTDQNRVTQYSVFYRCYQATLPEQDETSSVPDLLEVQEETTMDGTIVAVQE